MQIKSSLHIVTVATDIKYYMPYLIESVKKNHNNLTILGLNMKWTGFNLKFNLMKEHLSKLPEDDIVCFCDGYDVICVRDLNEMIDEFNRIKNKTKCKVIASTDFCLGQYYIKFSIQFTGTLARNYINSGLYMGCVKDLKCMFNIISSYGSEDNLDDQMLLNKFNQMNPGYIHIDKETNIFYTLFESNLLKYTIDKQFNKKCNVVKYIKYNDNNIYSIHNTKPFFIHAPGCENLDDILVLLGYNITNNVSKKLDLTTNNINYINKYKKLKNTITSWYKLYKLNLIYVYLLLLFIFIIFKLIKYVLL